METITAVSVINPRRIRFRGVVKVLGWALFWLLCLGLGRSLGAWWGRRSASQVVSISAQTRDGLVSWAAGKKIPLVVDPSKPNQFGFRLISEGDGQEWRLGFVLHEAPLLSVVASGFVPNTPDVLDSVNAYNNKVRLMKCIRDDDGELVLVTTLPLPLDQAWSKETLSALAEELISETSGFEEAFAAEKREMSPPGQGGARGLPQLRKTHGFQLVSGWVSYSPI